MRYLAWVAIFSLQMGMFVCGAGIDVCHAADDPTHIEANLETSQADDHSDNTPVDSTCAAHAAHVFLSLANYDQSQADYYTASANASLSLNLFEVYHLIEHPPRLLHS